MKINNDTQQDCFSGETIYHEIPQNEKLIEQIRDHTRKQYASSREQIEQEINDTFFTHEIPTKQKKETKRGKKKALPEELQF